ncbi:MAG: hypothetical protein ACYTGC_07385 [Planctomycetota bacterium]|jgi:hypothetical protein
MSVFGGSPIETSLVQTAQAQQVASKSRDREKAASEQARRSADQVELRVAGVESADAIRKLPQNESEQAEEEHRSGGGQAPLGEEPGTHIDVQA